MISTSEPRIYVAGHRGMVGSAILRNLRTRGAAHSTLITRTRDELDLTDLRAVEAFFGAERPDHVYIAAARVGGIHANNTYPADFIRDNLCIQTNVIAVAQRHAVKR